MSHPDAPKTLGDLRQFIFERVLNEDPVTHSVTFQGTFPSHEDTHRVNAVVRVEKTALSANDAPRFLSVGGLQKVEMEQGTDIYSWFFGWLGEDRYGDLKINIICPATDVHIKKYLKQEQILIQETPELYQQVVQPYITAFPASRTKWVENILDGTSEREKVLFSSLEFLILPDMKWDLITVGSLYLVAIVQDRSIRSLRDLRKQHLTMLNNIRLEAHRVANEKWGIPAGGLRFYIHYQPSYYHFHVHIVNANYQGGFLGMSVGQAHLLDDVIAMLELDPDAGPGIFEKITLTYGLGDQHGLFSLMRRNVGP